MEDAVSTWTREDGSASAVRKLPVLVQCGKCCLRAYSYTCIRSRKCIAIILYVVHFVCILHLGSPFMILFCVGAIIIYNYIPSVQFNRMMQLGLVSCITRFLMFTMMAIMYY